MFSQTSNINFEVLYPVAHCWFRYISFNTNTWIKHASVYKGKGNDRLTNWPVWFMLEWYLIWLFTYQNDKHNIIYNDYSILIGKYKLAYWRTKSYMTDREFDQWIKDHHFCKHDWKRSLWINCNQRPNIGVFVGGFYCAINITWVFAWAW